MARYSTALIERWAAARTHISRKFGHLAWEQAQQIRPRTIPGALRHLAAPICVNTVATARGDQREDFPVDADDLRAALTLIGPSRDDLKIEELTLIEGAREAGLTWEEIGQALGLPSRREAQQRWRRLNAWFHTTFGSRAPELYKDAEAAQERQP